MAILVTCGVIPLLCVRHLKQAYVRLYWLSIPTALPHFTDACRREQLLRNAHHKTYSASSSFLYILYHQCSQCTTSKGGWWEGGCPITRLITCNQPEYSPIGGKIFGGEKSVSSPLSPLSW